MAQLIIIYSANDLPTGFEQLHKMAEFLQGLGIETTVTPTMVNDPRVETARLQADLAQVSANLHKTPQTPRARRSAQSGNGQDKIEPVRDKPDKEAAAQEVNSDAKNLSDLHDLDDPDLDLTEPSLSGAEAKTKARALIQQIAELARDKKDALLRDLWMDVRRQMGVVRLEDIPETEGHRYYKLAVAAAEKAGVRV